MGRTSEKTIWITGASSGIGRAVAMELAEQKNKLILTARNRDKLEELALAVEKAGSQAIVAPGDVTDREEMRSVALAATNECGPIDVLFTCAGSYDPFDPTKFNSSEIARTMNVNYNGTLHCVDAVLPSMIERKSGYLVITSSIVGYRGLPKSAPYGATKAALINFFDGLRFDLEKYEIEVSIVNPGFVETPMTDKNDFEMPFKISPDEAADHIVKGMQKGKQEIHFPWKFTLILKAINLLPRPLYSFVIRRTAGK